MNDELKESLKELFDHFDLSEGEPAAITVYTSGVGTWGLLPYDTSELLYKIKELMEAEDETE